MPDKDIQKILTDLRHTADKLNLRVVAASKKNAPLTEERERKLDEVGFQLFKVLLRIEHAAEWYGARKKTPPEYDYRAEILQATHT